MAVRGARRAGAGLWLAGSIMARSLVGSACAQDDLVWDYFRYLDADPFQTQLTLTYAIPESDAIQFSANCAIGSGGTYAVVELGADIGGLPDGTGVDVQFVGNGFNHVVLGDVIGANAEVGITGVTLALELSDPLWGAIRGLNELYYNVIGFPAVRLPLSGSSAPTQQFLDDCFDMPGPEDAVAAPGAPVEPVEPAPPASGGGQPAANAISCSAFGSLRSVDGGAPADITFINRTGGLRKVMWLDHAGTPIHYRNLDPGDAYTQSTIVGHPWMIADGEVQCLEIYMPPAGGSVFEITAAN